MKPSIRDVEKAVCYRFNLAAADLRGPSRKKCYARPRQIAMYLAREMTGKSYPVISRYFGNRDHTTAIHGCRVIGRLMLVSQKILLAVGHVRANVQSWQPDPADIARLQAHQEEIARHSMMGLA